MQAPRLIFWILSICRKGLHAEAQMCCSGGDPLGPTSVQSVFEAVNLPESGSASSVPTSAVIAENTKKLWSEPCETISPAAAEPSACARLVTAVHRPNCSPWCSPATIEVQ